MIRTSYPDFDISICPFCGRRQNYMVGSDGTRIWLECPCKSLVPEVYEENLLNPE